MSMEKLIENVIQQSPFVGALLMVLWFVFNYIKHRDHENRLDRGEFLKLVKEMHDEHLEARKESREAIKENTTVIRENTGITLRLTEAVTALKS